MQPNKKIQSLDYTHQRNEKKTTVIFLTWYRHFPKKMLSCTWFLSYLTLPLIRQLYSVPLKYKSGWGTWTDIIGSRDYNWDVAKQYVYRYIDSLLFVGYQFPWISWVQVNHEIKCSTNGHPNIWPRISFWFKMRYAFQLEIPKNASDQKQITKWES